MIHYSCDLCGCSLSKERFVAKVEITAAFDPEEICEDDLDADHLEQVAATIKEIEQGEEVPLADYSTKVLQFDFCPTCREKYANDPLRLESLRRFNFSEN